MLFVFAGCNGIIALAMLTSFGMSAEIEQVFQGSQVTPYWRCVAEHSAIPGYLLLSAAYIVIGAGLWKLKNWARQTLIVLSTVYAVICGLVFPLVGRLDAFRLPMFLTMATVFAMLAWYLVRPYIRTAFGANKDSE